MLLCTGISGAAEVRFGGKGTGVEVVHSEVFMKSVKRLCAWQISGAIESRVRS